MWSVVGVQSSSEMLQTRPPGKLFRPQSTSQHRPVLARAGPSQLEEQQKPQEKIERKSKAFGEWMIETSNPDSLEQPPASDFFSGSQWEIVGQTAGFAIPVIATLLVLVGFIAAGSYMDGATSVLQKPGSPEDTAKIMPFPSGDQ